MEDETTGLWSKKSDELTVGDSVKVAVTVTVITTAAAIAVMAVAGSLGRWAAKLQERREAKLEVVTEEG
jgi:hypothetical protein